MPNCKFPTCDESVYAREYCRGHYIRLLKYGDPAPRSQQAPHRIGLSLADRLWSYVDRSGGPTACWPFMGKGRSSNFGYGMLWNGDIGRVDGAHRIAWTVTHGAIPAGLQVLHACDVPLCCNPIFPRGLLNRHLKLLNTRATTDSTRERMRADAAIRDLIGTFGPEIHLFLGTQADNVADMQRKERGTYGPFAKLTPDLAREIRMLAAQGIKKTELARQFGVHRMTIARIVKGEIWKHVDR